MPVAAMSLDEYRALTYHLTRPTRAQLEAFALHVSQAHSWYKKLPIAPPGRGFCFYIDPCAGMDIVQRAAGRYEVQWRERNGFHYNQLPTAEHRQRFGYLAFCSGGIEVVPEALKDVEGLRLPAGNAAVIYDPAMRGFRALPVEVLRAGVARFSSVVHDHIQKSGFLGGYVFTNTDLFGDQHADQQRPPYWPEESGGLAMLGRMRERLLELRRIDEEEVSLPWEQRRNSYKEDPVIGELLAPERRRQHLGMIGAAERVMRLIAGDADA